MPPCAGAERCATLVILWESHACKEVIPYVAQYTHRVRG
jgi:hypothetical protein